MPRTEELQLETRECQHCRHFVAGVATRSPTCRSRLMAVLPDMHVCFYPSDGTCWEPLPRERIVNRFLGDLAHALKTGTIDDIRALHAAFLRDEEGA